MAYIDWLLATSRGVARVRHMGPRPQPQRLCPLKFHKLALGAATLSRNCRTLKIGLATPLATSESKNVVKITTTKFWFCRAMIGTLTPCLKVPWTP